MKISIALAFVGIIFLLVAPFHYKTVTVFNEVTDREDFLNLRANWEVCVLGAIGVLALLGSIVTGVCGRRKIRKKRNKIGT